MYPDAYDDLGPPTSSDEPEPPEGRMGYKGEIPLKESVFEYRDKKRKENWFDWFLWLTYSFCWYYDINRFKSMEDQDN